MGGQNWEKSQNQKVGSYVIKVLSYWSSSSVMEVKSEVQNHIDVNACEICFKSFKRKEGLQKHRKLHERTDRIQCKLCDKIFVTAANLKVHQATHSGEMTH